MHPDRPVPGYCKDSDQQRLLVGIKHPPSLTPAEIARQTNLPYDSVRLLLGRMVEAREIGHPARGYYIAHQHHSLDIPNNQPPATTDTTKTM